MLTSPHACRGPVGVVFMFSPCVGIRNISKVGPPLMADLAFNRCHRHWYAVLTTTTTDLEACLFIFSRCLFLQVRVAFRVRFCIWRIGVLHKEYISNWWTTFIRIL